MSSVVEKPNGKGHFDEWLPEQEKLEGEVGHDEHEGIREQEVAVAKDKTSLPNWLMPILCFVLLSLLGFVFTTLQGKIDDIKQLRKEDATEVRIWRTYVINLTLEMKARGMNPPPIPDTDK